jgi:GNAT superfamily N-acetyltransferase
MSAQAAAVHDKLEPTIRGLVKDDWAYILDSFKKSYRELGADGYVPKFTYWPEMHKRIEGLRENPAVEFRIAADPDDANFIWGYAIVEAKSIVHYVFVRASAQGQGVARLLLADVPRPIPTTHWTKIAEAINKSHPGVLLNEPSRRT